MIRFQSLTYDIKCYNDKITIHTIREPSEYFALTLETISGRMEQHLGSLRNKPYRDDLINKGFQSEFINALRTIPSQAYPQLLQKMLDPTWHNEYCQSKQAHKNIIEKAQELRKALRDGRSVSFLDLTLLHMTSVNKTNCFIDKVIAETFLV